MRRTVILSSQHGGKKMATKRLFYCQICGAEIYATHKTKKTCYLCKRSRRRLYAKELKNRAKKTKL